MFLPARRSHRPTPPVATGPASPYNRPLMTQPATYYVTTPIYYVNDRPHIGHVYTTVVADIVARYHRLRGEDTFFLTGTDEHALKVVDAAAERGLTPQQWADQNAAAFEQTFQRLGLTFDDFIRTSQDRHRTLVQQYVQQLWDQGDIYLDQYEGWYDAGQEEYVTEAKAKEYDYVSPFNGKPLVKKSETNYFFRLSRYEQRLLDLLEGGDPHGDGPVAVAPEARKNETIARIKEGLKDVPISRVIGEGEAGWGVPMPGDAQHRIYVWIDALFNYLTAVESEPERRGHYWPADVHLIAKDILWFHAVIWPAMLIALHKPLPRLVYAHSFWISEGQKMSKSLGNFIDLEKIDYYVETYSLDALRYFLASNGPMGTTDSDFAEAKFIDVYNGDLANGIGNCFNRIANMTNKYFGGEVQKPTVEVVIDDGDLPQRIIRSIKKVGTIPVDDPAEGYYNKEEKWPQEELGPGGHKGFFSGVEVEIADCLLSKDIIQKVDAYIEQTQPFKLAKDESRLPEVGTILYNCAEAIRIASLLLWPVIPEKVEELWRRMQLPYGQQLAARGRGKLDDWLVWGQLEPGTPIEKGQPLFPRQELAKS
jgi:methionyl-tRNA synthetase